MTRSFSSKDRALYSNELTTNSFDLLIVGGGITGAGIALDAAARGLKVALVDMQDFAAGTSGRSTKLIHGGLRYLKQLEFGLVAEVGKERKIIHHLAPHLTKPEHMLLPLMKGDSLGKFSAGLGMFIYEHLAGVLTSERNKSLNPEQVLLQEPLLQKEKLKGGILFYEYRTDDARLTMEVLKQAVQLGATAINYMKVESFLYSNNGKLIGANVTDQFTGAKTKITTKYIVNAAGPWVDELAGLDKAQASKLKITKGVHLVFDHKKLPVHQSVYFEAPDKRMLFVIPRNGKTYVGTTDTFYTGEMKDPHITTEDRDYLLTCVNNYFNLQLLPVHIESGWAGLRPLINKPGKKAGEISRKDEIFISETGLVTIAGGKLTGYRKMAERVMKVIAKKIKDDSDKTLAPCTTDNICLSGGKPDKPFQVFIEEMVDEGIHLDLVPEEAEALSYRYGSNVQLVYTILKKIIAGELSGSKSGLPNLLYAELIYAVEHEMCFSPADFLIRRTSFFYFNIQLAERWCDAITADLADLLKMDEEMTGKFRKEMSGHLEKIRMLRV